MASSSSSSLGDGENEKLPFMKRMWAYALDKDGPPVGTKPEARYLSRMFWTIFVLEMCLNFDSGAVPAVLPTIESEYHMSKAELGLLGGLQYIALTLTSTWAGQKLMKHSPKHVLRWCLLGNTIFVFFMGLLDGATPEKLVDDPDFNPTFAKWVLLVARFGIGFSQTGILIYAPVWVDSFAPESKRTMWMALLQAGIPLGVMVGYATAGFLEAYSVQWQWSLIIQAGLLSPLSVGLFLCPKYLIDTDTKAANEGKDAEAPPQSPTFEEAANNPELARVAMEARKDSMEMDTVPLNAPRGRSRSRVDSLWQYTDGGKAGADKLPIRKQLRIVLRSKMFIFLTAAIAALYFVVSGIQFWMTDYLLTCIDADKKKITLCFTIVSATGPAIGVVFGGIFVDKMGGYRGARGMATTTKILTSFAFFAVVMGVPAAYLSSLVPIIVLVWFLLFFGGAIIPAATGLILASVPEAMRPFASAISMLFNNIMGFAGGTFLPGIFMQILLSYDFGGVLSPVVDGKTPLTDYSQCNNATVYGMRLIFLWSFFGLGSIFVTAWVTHKKLKAGEVQEHEDPNRRPATLSELENSEERSRMLSTVSVQEAGDLLLRRYSQMPAVGASAGLGVALSSTRSIQKLRERLPSRSSRASSLSSGKGSQQYSASSSSQQGSQEYAVTLA